MRLNKRFIIWLTPIGRMKVFVSLAIVMLLVLVIGVKGMSYIQSSVPLPLTGLTIALDPGHGGPDGGAVSREGALEKHINLAVSLYLRDYLQQGGALVVMTREEDKDLAEPGAKRRKTQDLHRRVELVNSRQADILISIHMNSIPSSRWRGAQTFYNPRQHEESKTLASLIQDEIKLNMKNTTREANVIHDTYLLKMATMPAALVEVGFLSNVEEARLLSDEKYQRQMAEAIYRGIMRFASGEKFGTP